MPTTKEFTIQMEDQPGTLAKFCWALADRRLNIVAFQSFPFEGQSRVRLVLDNPTAAKTVFDDQGINYTEAEVAQVKLPNRPGELARAASQLGEANININYAYGGIDSTTNAPLLVFGVPDARRAASILDEAAAKAA